MKRRGERKKRGSVEKILKEGKLKGSVSLWTRNGNSSSIIFCYEFFSFTAKEEIDLSVKTLKLVKNITEIEANKKRNSASYKSHPSRTRREW